MIAIIDEESGSSTVKGQNQRNYEIGTFPREILDSVSERVEKPSNNVIKSHSAVSFNNHQQHLQPTHGPGFSREKSFPTAKQFSYHKFKNEKNVNVESQQQQQRKSLNLSGSKPLNNKNTPARPPQPRFEPRNGILIDLGPEETAKSMESNMRNTKDTNSRPQSMQQCILDMPIPGTVDEYFDAQPDGYNHTNLPSEYSTDSFESLQNVYANQNAPRYNLDNYYSASTSPQQGNTYDEVPAGFENVYNNQEIVTSQNLISNTMPANTPNHNIIPAMSMSTYSNSGLQPPPPQNIYNTPENYYDSVYSSAIYGNAARPNYSQSSPYQQLSDQQINRRMNYQKTTIDQLMEKLKLEQVTVEEASSALQKSNGNMDDAIRVFKVKRLER